MNANMNVEGITSSLVRVRLTPSKTNEHTARATSSWSFRTGCTLRPRGQSALSNGEDGAAASSVLVAIVPRKRPGAYFVIGRGPDCRSQT